MVKFIAATVFLCGLGLAGCDRTIESTEVKTSGPGGTSEKKQTVTENADGTITEKKTERKETTPNP